MKKFRKIIIIATLVTIILGNQFIIKAETSEQTTQKTLYTLPSVSDINITGTYRGNGHDRQNLGIYMKQGASFEIRQTNKKLNQDLTLQCLNNDSQTEKNYTIPKNGDWVTITVDYDSVPFIRTVFGTEEEPKIEMKNLQGTEELTYYYYQYNEEEFFNKWKNNNHSYAVIENDRATFLVPIKDRDLIVRNDGNSYNFKSIDEMLEYYHDFVEQFDRYLGLSYDTDNSLDKNIKTKFFVKANKHGAGAAYYSANHTAQNGDSISGYLSKGWLNLHEFGHGYEGSLANQDLQLVDVMNNILAHYYQVTYLRENDGGWLGKKLNIEENIKNARESVSNYNELSYQQKLYSFVDLLDKIGPEKSMAYVHSKYREYAKQGVNYNASDMFAKSFSEVSGYNVIPYLNSYKITPSEDIQAEIYEHDMPFVYYLRDLVSTDQKTEQIREELNLEGRYSLVSNQDIEKYNMKGSIKLNISINDFEQIKGQKIYIKDGKNVVKEITIEDKNIVLNNIPAGVYRIQSPKPKNNAYRYQYEYIVVKENTINEKNIEYKKINTDTLSSDTLISFRGLGDSEFAKLKMDMENKKLQIISNNMSSHVYFTDEYANLQIVDTQGNVVYEKSYIGNVPNPSNDTIDVDFGYKIKIKHREASGRLVFNSQVLNKNEEFKNSTNEQTTYTITKYGLQKEGTSDEQQYEIFKRKIDAFIEKIKSNISAEKQEDRYCYFMQKNQLLSNILELNETDKEKYLTENKKLLGLDALYVLSDTYKIENSYISRVNRETTKTEFIKNLNTNGNVKIFLEDGTELNEDNFVGTGMKVQINMYGETKEFYIVVMGDFSGDGKVTAQDLSTINKAILKILDLDEISTLAGDIDENGKLTATDLSEVNQILIKVK